MGGGGVGRLDQGCGDLGEASQRRHLDLHHVRCVAVEIVARLREDEADDLVHLAQITVALGDAVAELRADVVGEDAEGVGMRVTRAAWGCSVALRPRLP